MVGMPIIKIMLSQYILEKSSVQSINVVLQHSINKKTPNVFFICNFLLKIYNEITILFCFGKK